LARGLGLGKDEGETGSQVASGQHLVSQAEIQQDLQRFFARFSERMTQATQEIVGVGPSSKLYEPALRHALLATSSGLDITAGPTPEVNLLDMIVFLTLSREAFERHYVPNVFGAAGEDIARAFRTSEQEIWQLGRKVLKPEQETLLHEAIRAWQAEHPEQTRVAGVRFAEFSGLAADARHRTQASGILAGVRSATHTADAALLLGERAMFLAPRIPFVVRLHARLGTHEIMADSLAQLDRVEALLQRVDELNPMLSQLSTLVDKTSSLAVDAQRTSASAQALSESAWPLLQGAERLLETSDVPGTQANRVQLLVESTDSLVTRTRSLVQDLNGIGHGDPLATLQAATARLEHFTQRLLWQAALVGGGLIVLFWIGYYLTRHVW
jgi:hypothetical protein